jgi:serine/threonine protein kinase
VALGGALAAAEPGSRKRAVHPLGTDARGDGIVRVAVEHRPAPGSSRERRDAVAREVYLPWRMEPPRQLGPYELVRPIASGGMATVHLARRSGPFGFQRLVAIKVLHPEVAESPDLIAMFLDEARLAAAIHHPNVVGVVEIEQADVGYYLVMEYVEGVSLHGLRSRLLRANRPFPQGAALRIVTDALRGLHAAHLLETPDGKPAGLVHRDATPQNVLVGVDGSARITDFGVATARARLASTRAGTLKGKLAYMAPEQVDERPLDCRVDVFAAGVMLWELLAGRRLFQASSEVETLRRVLQEQAPSLIPEGLPPALDAVAQRALARDPDARFPSAEAFADALESAAVAGGSALAPSSEVASLVRSVLGEGESPASRSTRRSWPVEDVVTTRDPAQVRSTSVGTLGPATVSAGGEPSRPVKERPSRRVPVALLGIGVAVALATSLSPRPATPSLAARPGIAASTLDLLGRRRAEPVPLEPPAADPARPAGAPVRPPLRRPADPPPVREAKVPEPDGAPEVDLANPYR